MSHPISPIDVHGRRITRLDLARAMRINIVAGCLGLIWMGMSVGMPLAMFLEAIGTSGFLIGLMMTVRFVVMLSQIPSAFFAERFSSRKPTWTYLTLVHRALWFGVAALAFLWEPGQWWLPLAVIVIVGVSDLLGNSATALWYSWMTDLIPPGIAGRFWGWRQAVTTAASLVGMGLAGYILDHFRTQGNAVAGFGVVFGIAAVAGVVDIIVHQRVVEPKPAVVHPGSGGWGRLLEPLRNRDFRHLTLAIGAWSFGVNIIAVFGIVYFKRDFPVTYTHVAALTIAGALGAISSSHLLGILTDRLGPRVLAAVLMVLAPLTMVGWFFVHGGYVTLPWLGWTFPQVLVVQTVATFVGGALFAGILPCQLRLAAVLSQAKGRTMAMAVHWSVIGLITALGTLVGGVIMDWCVSRNLGWVMPNGTVFSYLQIMVVLFAVLVWFVALPLILSIRTRVDYVPFSDALARVFMTNPVNAFRNIYSLQMISAGRPAHERARAARKLGQGRSEIAVPELAARLDDPSLEVQEEAISALGGINTPEAVSALLSKLDDPSCETLPQIARALRHSGERRCVEPLIAQLQTQDRETLVECVRTLGALGDRRAVPALLEVLAHTRERKVLAVASDALSQLGELSAVYQIIAQMRSMPNRMLKRALSVAVGDLLGQRDRFYQLLIADAEAPGSGGGQVLHEMRKSVAKRCPALLESLDAVDSAYLDGDIPRCAPLLLGLGLELSGGGKEADDAFAQLLEQDHQAALGLWYLKVCNEPWLDAGGNDTRDVADLLLGLHIVHGLLSRPASGRTTAAPRR